MSEQLLTVLRLGLLGLIYLFFLRVLRAVWVEVNGPTRPRARVAAPPRPAPAVPAPLPSAQRTMVASRTLRVTEPSELRGRSFAVTEEVTIGRSPECAIQLEDTYVSQLHARVLADADGCRVEDLGSTNGTYVNREKVIAPTPLRPGDRLQVGNVVLELV